MNDRRNRLLLIISFVIVLLIFVDFKATKAKSKNYKSEDVTWLGTTAEYKKTLEAFFDMGLRKVAVGDKYGLVDSSGAFIAQPIYDEIEAYYLNKNDHTSSWKETDQNKEKETIFVGGYVQARRNGKMGLLDQTGKEVIPCKYDEVGLPREGISRLIVKSNGINYLGYWNIEKGKEIVKPNKYVIDSSMHSFATASGDLWFNGQTGYEELDTPDKDGKIFVAFDYNDGYALVPTGKLEEVKLVGMSGIYGKKDTYTDNSYNTVTWTLTYAQIIDKNGKEILPKAYPFIMGGYMLYYPQSGPYMVYGAVSNNLLHMRSDAGDDIMYKSHVVSGVVGKKGVVIKAQYHGGIVGNAAIGWSPNQATMQIISKKSLVITDKCKDLGFKESAARRGAVNFSNKTIIPFDSVMGYDSTNDVVIAGDQLYRTNGEKISNTNTSYKSIKGGYEYIIKDYPLNGFVRREKGILKYNYNKDGSDYKVNTTEFVSLKNGKIYDHKNLQGIEYLPLSKQNTVWVNKGSEDKAKWGLVDLSGKILLPFGYEEVYIGDTWTDKKNSYATVNKNGKWGIVDERGNVLLKCSYQSIESPRGSNENYFVIQDSKIKKKGVYSLKQKKITVPCNYESISVDFRESSSGTINGTSSVVLGNSLKALLDLETGKLLTDMYLSMTAMNRGLFSNSYNDIFGSDGKLVFTRVESYETHTLVIEGGKVGSIHTDRLAIDGKLPTDTYVKPILEPIQTKGYLVAYPNKQLYLLNDGFDITGLIVHYQDEYGARKVIDNSKLKFYTSGTVELTQKRKFTTEGIKTVDVQYKGMSVASFEVKVINGSNLLPTGNYYFKINGKYLYPVAASGILWMELSDKKPSQPFEIKLFDYSESRGPMYMISYDGTYINQPSSKDGVQLQSSNVPHVWRINQYSSFITLRDYGNQTLLVNASGNESKNGTKVIVSKSQGKAPENAKVECIVAK